MRRSGKKQSMPMTGAGLIRYFDEETKGMRVPPLVIIIVAILIALIEIVLVRWDPLNFY
jgi:preprotein translocase subunit Sec61beta